MHGVWQQCTQPSQVCVCVWCARIRLKYGFSDLLQQLQVSGKESQRFLVESDLAVTFTGTCNAGRVITVLTMLPKAR